MVKALPNTSFLPVPKSAPAGHTTAAAHLLWQVFPRYPCLEYKDNSGQSCPVRYTWTASFGPGLMFWQKWFYLTPQFVAYQFPGHLLHPHWYFTAYSSICQVLLGALSRSFFLLSSTGSREALTLFLSAFHFAKLIVPYPLTLLLFYTSQQVYTNYGIVSLFYIKKRRRILRFSAFCMVHLQGLEPWAH